MTKKRRITARARGFLRSTRAVSALEYAILVGVIAVGVTAAITTFGEQIEAALTTISGNLTGSVGDIGIIGGGDGGGGDGGGDGGDS